MRGAIQPILWTFAVSILNQKILIASCLVLNEFAWLGGTRLLKWRVTQQAVYATVAKQSARPVHELFKPPYPDRVRGNLGPSIGVIGQGERVLAAEFSRLIHRSILVNR